MVAYRLGAMPGGFGGHVQRHMAKQSRPPAADGTQTRVFGHIDKTERNQRSIYDNAGEVGEDLRSVGSRKENQEISALPGFLF
jgi:hypothetical protein